MKKILSILMILVLVGGVAFAQIELAPEGSATLSWGIDLGVGDKAKPMHGFNNEHELGLFIPFLYNKQAFKGGSADVADVYAEVTFKATPSVSSYWVDPKDWDISARLNFYGAYMTVYGKPDFGAAYAKGWAPINKATGWKAANANWFAPSFEGFGTKIGYANKNVLGGIDLGLKFGSDGNWLSEGKAGSSTKKYEVVVGDGTTVVGAADVYYLYVGKLMNGEYVIDGDKLAAGATLAAGTKYVKETTVVKAGTPAIANHYAAGFDFEMTPVEKYLTVNATVNAVFEKDKYGTNDSKRQLNFGVGITSKPIEGMTVKAGFDGAAVDGFAWDAGLSAAFKWVDAALYFAGKSDKADGKDFNMAAHLAFASKEEGDTNFVKGLAFGVAANAYNLLSDKVGKAILPLGLMANVSYKAAINDSMWVKPYAAFYAESNHGVDKVFGLAYKAGVVYSPIEKVEVEAAWNHGILAKNTYEGGFDGQYMIKTPLNNKGHNGRFVLSLKLIY